MGFKRPLVQLQSLGPWKSTEIRLKQLKIGTFFAFQVILFLNIGCYKYSRKRLKIGQNCSLLQTYYRHIVIIQPLLSRSNTPTFYLSGFLRLCRKETPLPFRRKTRECLLRALMQHCNSPNTSCSLPCSSSIP